MEDENIFLFVPNLIGYARLALAAAAFYLMPAAPAPAAACYLLSGLLDAVDGHAARLLGQGTRFGALLDMLTDRCATMCLLVNLALLYPARAALLQASMALDVASHWMHLHSSVLRGSSSHKSVALTGNPVLRLYYTSRPFLFLMCAGNELFYCLLYLLHFTEGPTVLPGRLGLFRVALWLSAPVALLKTLINVVHLVSASRDLAAIDRAERRARSQ